MPLRAVAELGLPDSVRAAIAEDRLGAVVADNSRVLAANDAYLRLVGFSRSELESEGVSWLRLTPAEWLATDARAIGELRATGASRPYEKEYIRRDGTRIRVILALMRLGLDPLRIFAVVGDAEDDAARGTIETLATPA